MVLRKGVGIGSAGLPSYNLLLEGHTQALENDVVIYMKQAQVPAVARYITDQPVRDYFQHQGHRTAESQRALQAHADPWLGYTELGGVGQLVAEVSPYAADLDWGDVNEPAELAGVVGDLGRAVARMHSVADDESSHDLVDFSTEEAIVAAVGRRRGRLRRAPGRLRPRVRGRGPAPTTSSSSTCSATGSSQVSKLGRMARIERLVTSGTFSLDGETFDVDNNVWIVGDDTEAIVIDAAHDAAAILHAVGSRHLLAIVCTHGHDDHIDAAPEVALRTGAPILLHPEDLPLWHMRHPDLEPSRPSRTVRSSPSPAPT